MDDLHALFPARAFGGLPLRTCARQVPPVAPPGTRVGTIGGVLALLQRMDGPVIYFVFTK